MPITMNCRDKVDQRAPKHDQRAAPQQPFALGHQLGRDAIPGDALGHVVAEEAANQSVEFFQEFKH